MIHMYQACESALPHIFSMLDTTANRELAGSPAQPLPGGRPRDQEVRKLVLAGRTWIGNEVPSMPGCHRTVVTVSILPPDEALWLPGEQAAVTISFLAARPRFARQENLAQRKSPPLLQQVVNWAAYHAREQLGAAYVTTDALAANATRREIYTALGFEDMGTFPRAGSPAVTLFRMPTAEVTEADFPGLSGEPALGRPAPAAASPGRATRLVSLSRRHSRRPGSPATSTSNTARRGRGGRRLAGVGQETSGRHA